MLKINQLVGVDGHIYQILALHHDWVYVGKPGRVYPGYWRPYGTSFSTPTHQWVKQDRVTTYQ